ncbi:hypothetical protein GCM10027346_10660 [Hymenobacter seoulensis]
MKRLLGILCLLLGFGPASYAAAPETPITITGSEPYELTNIILALTPYGREDEFEVYKKSTYYRQVLAHFGPYMQHPLLAKVNYSRKEWDKYLSFRTDSYAFDFGADGQLQRRFPFATQDGMKPFEDNLGLVNDFVRASGFRAFYQAHKPYYDSVSVAYQQSQMLPEMLAFLKVEMGGTWTPVKYAVVISPLVHRMNCHRTVNGVATDFVSLPAYVIDGTTPTQVSEAEKASEIHMLFTEMDHGFVNPVSDQHASQITQAFSSKQWDTGSGYENLMLATFNEYMTWAVYDLFLYKYFPHIAPLVAQDWALQNESRGFFASSLFNAKLKALYDSKGKNQKISDLYPALLKWCKKTQPHLSQPTITACPLQNADLTNSLKAAYEITFSEPMQELAALDMVQVAATEPRKMQVLTLTHEANKLAWHDNGQKLYFEVALENNCQNQVAFNIPWRTKTALRSKKGVDLLVYKSIITTQVKVAKPE